MLSARKLRAGILVAPFVLVLGSAVAGTGMAQPQTQAQLCSPQGTPPSPQPGTAISVAPSTLNVDKGNSVSFAIYTSQPPQANADSDIVTVSTPSKPSGSECYTATVTGKALGHTTITVSNGLSDAVSVRVYVRPRPFVISAGGGYALFAPQSKSYAIQPGPVFASPLPVPSPLPTGDTVNRIVESDTTNTPASLIALAHIRLSQNADAVNTWFSLGLGQNSQGPIFGLSVSPPRSDLVWLTVGVRQETQQQLLHGYNVGQAIPSGVSTISQTVKTPRLFVSLSADPAALGCVFNPSSCSTGSK